MINKELLEQIGWSSNLIDSVTATADTIRKHSPLIGETVITTEHSYNSCSSFIVGSGFEQIVPTENIKR